MTNAQKRTSPLSMSGRIKRQLPLYAMLLPGFLFLIIFNYLPMFGTILAFKDFSYTKGILFSRWIGLKNFEVFFRTPDAWVITRNTVLYNLVFIVLGLVVNVAVAVMLTEITSKKISKVYQTVMLMPHFLSWVIVAYLLYAFLSSDYGIVNVMLEKFGIKHISWYSETKYWPYIIVLINRWKTTGYGSIVYLAAIAGISTEYYEAAVIDGAGKFKQMVYITLPCLKPVMTIMTILAIGSIFSSDFGLFYQVPMNSGALYPVTNVISTYIYRARGDVGISSAAGLYQGLVGFVLVVVTNKIVNKIDPENALY